MTDLCDAFSLNQLPKADRCQFALKACRESDAHFSPISLHFCTFEENPWISVPIICLLLILLFDLIGFVCEGFFVPALLRVITKLQIKKTTAAKTLVPIANSAGDIITIIVSAGGGGGESLSMSLGMIFGANMIVTSVLFAFLILASTRLEFIDLRNSNFEIVILFFAGSSLILVACNWANSSFLLVALLSFVMFVGYIVVSSLDFTFGTQGPAAAQPAALDREAVPNKEPGMLPAPNSRAESALFEFSEPSFNEQIELEVGEKNENPETTENQRLINEKVIRENANTSKVWSKLLHRLLNFWTSSSQPGRLMAIADSPLRLLVFLTIPQSIHLMVHPLEQFLFPFTTTAMILSNFFFSRLSIHSFHLMVWQLGFIVSFCLTCYLIFKYSRELPHARDHSCLIISAITIAGSVYWVKNLAEVLIEAVRVIGLVSGLSRALLGSTMIALGSCLPDLIINTFLAFNGFPAMAVINSFAAQLMNLQIGFGLTCLMIGIDEKSNARGIRIFDFQKKDTKGEYLISATMIFAFVNELYLLAKLSFVNGGKLFRIDGYVGIAIYCIFLTLLVAIQFLL